MCCIECLLWVISRHVRCKTSCPLYPQLRPKKRTSICVVGHAVEDRTSLCPSSPQNGNFSNLDQRLSAKLRFSPRSRAGERLAIFQKSTPRAAFFCGCVGRNPETGLAGWLAGWGDKIRTTKFPKANSPREALKCSKRQSTKAIRLSINDWTSIASGAVLATIPATRERPEYCPAGLVAEVGLRWCGKC
jgi:hypothetical protein